MQRRKKADKQSTQIIGQLMQLAEKCILIDDWRDGLQEKTNISPIISGIIAVSLHGRKGAPNYFSQHVDGKRNE